MPNLVGVYDRDGTSAALAASVDAQLRLVASPCDVHRLHRCARNGFAAALLEHRALYTGAQPAMNADGERLLLFDGELFNGDELRGDLPATSTPRSSAALCLELIERDGFEALRRLNGFFVIVLHESKAGRVHLISDHFGFRPLFYRAQAGRAVFGTELKAVATNGAAARIDPHGLVELLCCGSHVGESTWIDGCRRIAPATVVTIDASGASSKPYWQYQYDERAARLDQESYVVNVAKLLDRAVERQVSRAGRPAIFLSGGYDSRAIAASIRPHHLPLPAFTFGRSASRDARIAPVLAQRLGLRHQLLGDHAGHLHAHCHYIAWRTEGMLPFHRTTSVQHHAAIGREADVLLLGFLGELSGSHTWPSLLLARSRRAAMQSVFDRITTARRGVVARVVHPQVLEAAMAQLRERVAAQFAAIDNENPLNLADAWRLRYLHPRTSYQATAVDRERFEIRAPQIDNDLVDFQLRIPPLARIEQRVYKKVIASSFPAIRDVPCANSERPIDPSFIREYARMVLDYAGRAATKVGRQLLTHGEPMGREITDFAEDFRSEPELLHQVLEPLLARGIFDATIFDVEGIRAVADEHYAGRGRHEEILGSLIAWGLAASFILAGDERPPPSAHG